MAALTTESDALAKLAVRVLCDTAPSEAPDAIYLFTELPDNMPSCYRGALRALARWPGVRVLLSGEDGTRVATVAGFDDSGAAAVALGVPAGSLEAVPFDAAEAMIHTRNEAVFLARHCAARGYRRVLVCAPPLHALRAFATACSVVVERGDDAALAYYCWPGDADP